MKPHQLCAACRFFDADNHECRRWIPEAFAEFVGEDHRGDWSWATTTRWPYVSPHDWCGEWQAAS